MAPSTSTIDADMNKSSVSNALNNKGHSVGRLSTTDTIILPEIKNGNK